MQDKLISSEQLLKVVTGDSFKSDFPRMSKALVKIIKALPSVRPQEQKTGHFRDCISRDYLLSIANKDGAYGYVSAHDIINAPCYNPQEPKTGHWIPIEYPTGVEAFGVKEMSAQELKCSECGKTVDISDGDFKYCPYCKAKMESEDKE